MSSRTSAAGGNTMVILGGVLALFVGGTAAAATFGQFKKEEDAKFRHKKIDKPPMYLFDDSISVVSEVQNTDGKSSTTVLLTEKNQKSESMLILDENSQYFDHPCSGKEMQFSTNKIPVQFALNENHRCSIRLDLKDITIYPVDYYSSVKGSFYVFQESFVTKIIQMDANATFEAFIPLSVENFWFPGENFELFLLFRFHFGHNDGQHMLQCKTDDPVRLDFSCKSAAQDSFMLTNVMSGSHLIRTFYHKDYLVAKLIPALNHRNLFYVYFSFPTLEDQMASFAMENLQRGQKYYCFVNLFKSNISVIEFQIDADNKIQFHCVDENNPNPPGLQIHPVSLRDGFKLKSFSYHNYQIEKVSFSKYKSLIQFRCLSGKISSSAYAHSFPQLGKIVWTKDHKIERVESTQAASSSADDDVDSENARFINWLKEKYRYYSSSGSSF